MYKSIETIKELHGQKLKIMDEVYAADDIDEVYRRQSKLNSMSIKIYTDTAVAMIPALKEDGLRSEAWANISGSLDKLQFIGVPTSVDIRRKYGKTDAIVVQNDRNEENRGMFERFGKVVDEAIRDVRKKFGAEKFPKKNMGEVKTSPSYYISPADYERRCQEAINRVKTVNKKELEQWFQKLEVLTQEELAKINEIKEE